MSNYAQIIAKFSRKKILVLGDVILDQYIRGTVSRISPEAPVPIVLQQESFYTPGGAANVANNLRSLGAKVALIGRVGDDAEGESLKKELKNRGIETRGILIDKNNPTITKTRIIAEHQQVVRIDREKKGAGSDPKVFEKIKRILEKNISSYDAIILSDYGKGLITSELVNFICNLAVENKKIITVDPKVEHFGYYRRVTSITPNLKEAENAIRNIKITDPTGRRLGINTEKLDNSEIIDLAGKELLKYLDLESLLITLGENGMRLFEKGKPPYQINTRAREVFDVTGAGDAVISTFTLSLTSGATKQQAAELANFAAGIVVAKMGAVPVAKEELLAATKDH